MKYKKLLFAPFLFFVSFLSANVLLPYSTLVLATIHLSSAFTLLILSYLVELICVRFLVKDLSLWYVSFSVLIMNVASSILGTIVIAILEMFGYPITQRLSFIVKLYQAVEEMNPFGYSISIMHLLLFFFAITIINSLIEYFVGILFFRKINRTKFFWYLILANALSNGIGVAGLIVIGK